MIEAPIIRIVVLNRIYKELDFLIEKEYMHM